MKAVYGKTNKKVSVLSWVVPVERDGIHQLLARFEFLSLLHLVVVPDAALKLIVSFEQVIAKSVIFR